MYVCVKSASKDRVQQCKSTGVAQDRAFPLCRAVVQGFFASLVCPARPAAEPFSRYEILSGDSIAAGLQTFGCLHLPFAIHTQHMHGRTAPTLTGV